MWRCREVLGGGKSEMRCWEEGDEEVWGGGDEVLE